jgi:hypothetical protein
MTAASIEEGSNVEELRKALEDLIEVAEYPHTPIEMAIAVEKARCVLEDTK